MNPGKSTNQPTHEAELNLFYMHHRDAETLTRWADEEESKLRSLYARHAILSVVFAAEALINRVLISFLGPEALPHALEKLNIQEKWTIAPVLIKAEPGAHIWFDAGKPPFQGFVELIKLRNWFVHPKPDEFIDAIHDGKSTISREVTDEGLPWIETLKGEVWPLTRIPKNPFELTATHAQKALSLLDAMIKELRDVLGGKLTKDWLWEFNLRSKIDGSSKSISLDALFGGYMPNEPGI